jgi:hypothetical protein
MISYNTEETLLGCFVAVVVLFFLGLLGAAAVDIAQDYRAFGGKVACQARRMEPQRQIFSARVVCVPVNTRQDTTTVRVDGLR